MWAHGQMKTKFSNPGNAVACGGSLRRAAETENVQ